MFSNDRFNMIISLFQAGGGDENDDPMDPGRSARIAALKEGIEQRKKHLSLRQRQKDVLLAFLLNMRKDSTSQVASGISHMPVTVYTRTFHIQGDPLSEEHRQHFVNTRVTPEFQEKLTEMRSDWSGVVDDEQLEVLVYTAFFKPDKQQEMDDTSTEVGEQHEEDREGN